eukprot:361032-Chlamydomonas_euryale.AAC.1
MVSDSGSRARSISSTPLADATASPTVSAKRPNTSVTGWCARKRPTRLTQTGPMPCSTDFVDEISRPQQQQHDVTLHTLYIRSPDASLAIAHRRVMTASNSDAVTSLPYATTGRSRPEGRVGPYPRPAAASLPLPSSAAPLPSSASTFPWRSCETRPT